MALKRFVRFAGILVLGVIAYRYVDFGEFFRTVRELDLRWAAVLIVAATVDRFLMIGKWQHLCRMVGVRVSLATQAAAYYGASFLGYFLPTTLGGDVYRGFRITRETPDRAQVVAAMMMEKVLGALSTIVFAWMGLIWLLRFGESADSRPIFWALFAVSGAAILGFVASLAPALHGWMLRPFAKTSLRETLEKLSRSYQSFQTRRGALASNFALAVVETAVQLGITVATAHALGLTEIVSFWTFAAVSAVNDFLRRISMILDGWGLAESLRILIYGLVGVPAADALAVGLVSHAIMAIASLPGALVFFGDPKWNDWKNAEPTPLKQPSKLTLIINRFLMPQLLVSLKYFLEARAVISFRAEVEPSPFLKLGKGTSVSSFVKMKSSAGPLHVGEHSGFATGCFLSSGESGLFVGDHVLCGPNVSIVASAYKHDDLDKPLSEQGSTSRGVRIGNNVWIGAGSTIVDGAEIGDNTIVVANSLVTRRYPPNVIIQGAPAKIILRRNRKEEGSKPCETKSSTSSEVPSAT